MARKQKEVYNFFVSMGEKIVPGAKSKQKVKEIHIRKEPGYLYYLGKDGDVWRSKMARAGQKGGQAAKVADAGVKREPGYLYFIDRKGDVSRSKMARGRS